MTKPTPPRRPRSAALLLAIFVVLCFPAVGEAGKEPKKRVGVTDFENRAGKVDPRFGNVGQALAEKLIEALIDTDKFVVLERIALADVLAEQNLDELAPVSPAAESRLTSTQAVIRGVVTNIEQVGGGKSTLRFGKVEVGGSSQRLVVTVNIRIIDTVTGQVIQSKTIDGVARIEGFKLISHHKDVATNTELERRLPIGKAMDKAVKEAVKRIVSGMEGIPWQGRVARVSGREVFINAGQQENVESGLRLRVFEQGARLIDPETNEDLGTLDEEIGVVVIERVQGRFSIARVVEGAGFARGNIVRPADGD